MTTAYPGGEDTFDVPTLPEVTPLSEAGTATRNHVQHHADMGAAMEAVQANASQITHDHSGTVDPTHGSKLLQANTHQSPDTDVSVVSLHHSIGLSGTQAAAGNHAHDYEGPSIFDKPLIICTSTTRPFDPQLGLMIFETDTNAIRAWTATANDILVELTGLNYTYNFNTANSATSLDHSIFSQTYVQGASPADGAMGAATPGNCSWSGGANVTCQCMAQAVVPGSSTTVTDDQVLTWTTGSTPLQFREFDDDPTPTNDAFLRMSVDGTSYVRFSLNDQGAAIYYTTSGPSGEALLGAVKSRTNNTHSTWVARADGGTYVLYVNNQQVIAVADYEEVVNVGAAYRGWGIGMTAAQGDHGAQRLPNNLTSINIADTHTTSVFGTEPIWQLLSAGAVPHIRAEARFRQTIIHGSKGHVVGFDTKISDWSNDPFTNFQNSQTDITIKEAGHYSIHVSVAWDPSFNRFDQAAVGVAVNGQDIARKTAQFMRGFGFAPGFPQTNELFFTYYLAQGDVVRVYAQHNADVDCWLWWDEDPPFSQTCWIELDFQGI